MPSYEASGHVVRAVVLCISSCTEERGKGDFSVFDIQTMLVSDPRYFKDLFCLFCGWRSFSSHELTVSITHSGPNKGLPGFSLTNPDSI